MRCSDLLDLMRLLIWLGHETCIEMEAEVSIPFRSQGPTLSSEAHYRDTQQLLSEQTPDLPTSLLPVQDSQA